MIHNNLSIENQYKRAIYHELGHWLVGREVGFDVGNITIGESYFGVYGNSEVKPIPKTKLTSANAVYDHLFNRVCVLLAGVIADVIWHKKYEPDIDKENDIEYFYTNGVMDKTAITDKGKINELLFIMNGIANTPTQDEKSLEDQMAKIQSEAWSRSLNLLNKNKYLELTGKELIREFEDSQMNEFTNEYLIQLQENSRGSEGI
ncbi:hypothetical protein [Pantoea coffeiphila]|uniref:Uncharacterized protein n=1 Tax=Pantoea coffeiphila TaxID=1465635 RepID=A0A2S9IC85_9GAMM|nr:hypothetical protein [Pantoea coffeiphila]PRD15410.1 hypothetical protein CQW29_10390 [Pantoea coffeiphila]